MQKRTAIVLTLLGLLCLAGCSGPPAPAPLSITEFPTPHLRATVAGAPVALLPLEPEGA